MPATIGKCRYENESRAISLRSRPGLAFDRRRAATSATTSKYSQNSAAATAVPTTAATTTPASTPTSAPAPMATIDSPSAISTIRPWRSAKWPGTSFQPLESYTYGPPMSSTSATTHRTPCRAPSVNAAATRKPQPIDVLTSSRPTEWRRCASSRLAR